MSVTLVRVVTVLIRVVNTRRRFIWKEAPCNPIEAIRFEMIRDGHGDQREDKVVKGTDHSENKKSESPKLKSASVCSICGKPASQLVDGEPSCVEHVGQIYEHQVEDYTRSHLSEWRK